METTSFSLKAEQHGEFMFSRVHKLTSWNWCLRKAGAATPVFCKTALASPFPKPKAEPTRTVSENLRISLGYLINRDVFAKPGHGAPGVFSRSVQIFRLVPPGRTAQAGGGASRVHRAAHSLGSISGLQGCKNPMSGGGKKLNLI